MIARQIAIHRSCDRILYLADLYYAVCEEAGVTDAESDKLKGVLTP